MIIPLSSLVRMLQATHMFAVYEVC
jgi:hypothetical protein